MEDNPPPSSTEEHRLMPDYDFLTLEERMARLYESTEEHRLMPD